MSSQKRVVDSLLYLTKYETIKQQKYNTALTPHAPGAEIREPLILPKEMVKVYTVGMPSRVREKYAEKQHLQSKGICKARNARPAQKLEKEGRIQYKLRREKSTSGRLRKVNKE